MRVAWRSADEIEALVNEVVVEREGSTNPQPAHHGEARMVNQTDAGRSRYAVRGNGGGADVRINHLDVDDRQEPVDQTLGGDPRPPTRPR